METLDPLLRTWLEEALARHAAGERSAALLAYRRIQSRFPLVAEAWTNAATLLRETGRAEEALAAAQRALELRPGDPDALAARGNALGDLERWAEASACFRAALALAPSHAAAQVNLGWALLKEGRLEAALAADETAVRDHPEVAEAHLNLGYTRLKLGRLEAAETAFAASLALAPDNALGHWNMAFVRLLQGRWAEAWPHYGRRLELGEARRHARRFDRPVWRGEPLAGRTLLVWAEQGFGDTIQFVRFLPQAKARGGRVVLQAQAALLGLLGTCAGVDQVVGEHEEAPPFDLHLPVLSLPEVLGATLDTLPAEVPYLDVPAGLRAAPPQPLAGLLAPQPGTFRVGLAWAGNPVQKDNATRSLDPALLAPLTALPNVRWFALQRAQSGYDPGRLPEAFRAVDLAPYLATFSETAWAMANLDFLITVDSAPAHLAGALGLPTACLLSFSPDWRWLWERTDCPFYPTLQLYRQPRPGDWASVVQRLLADLS